MACTARRARSMIGPAIRTMRRPAPTTTVAGMPDFSALASRLSGSLLLPSDDGFDDTVAAHKRNVVHRPDAVVVPADTSDVVEVVRFAADKSIPVFMQSTGHGAHLPVTSGILLATRDLQRLDIDADARTATIGAGVRWGAVVAAAAAHGLGTVPGASATVGVVGYLLGGGLGPLARSHGFSSDHVRSFTVVTGTGDTVVASAEQNPDLFWALRGGKAGLGIIIDVTVGLVERETLYAGSLWFDVAHAPAVVAGWIDWTRTASDDVTTSVALVKYPPFDVVPEPLRGRHLVVLRFAYPGDETEGAELAAPLRALAPVYLDGIGVLPVGEIARIHNDPENPGPSWGSGGLLGPVDADFARTWTGHLGEGNELPFIAAELRHIGAATKRDVPESSAVGGREADFTFLMIGAPDPALFDGVLPAAAGGVRQSIEPWFAPTTTINWVVDFSDRGELARAWSDETRARLDEVRARVDPLGILPFSPASAG